MKFATMKEFLASGLSVNALRTNDVLQIREWIELDKVVHDVARHALVAVGDLRDAGLSKDLGGLGTTVFEYEKNSDMTDAELTMDGETMSEEDTVEFTSDGTPIPLFVKDYRLGLRRLLASRRMGIGLDTRQALIAARKAGEKMETTLFNGGSLKAGSRTLYGYTTWPDRQEVDIVGNWDTTPANITADVEALLAAADAAFKKGPFTLYVPTAFWSKLRSQENQYKATTYLQRLLQYAEIKSVKWGYPLAANNVVLVQMTADCVQWGVGQDITNVQWDEKGGMVLHMRVMAAGAPLLYSDANGLSGVFHGYQIAS